MFITARVASTLEDEPDKLRLEVWFVEILVFVVVSAASTLDDELERLALEV